MTKAEWFLVYSESHRDPLNRAIHKVCVPAIVYAQTGLLWVIPSPFHLPDGFFAVLELALAMLFYLSWRDFKLAGLIFALYLPLNLLFWHFLSKSAPKAVLPLAAAIFIVAWIGQLIGHRIEGRRPSFFRDLQFLLIGPAWVLRHDGGGQGRQPPALAVDGDTRRGPRR